VVVEGAAAGARRASGEFVQEAWHGRALSRLPFVSFANHWALSLKDNVGRCAARLVVLISLYARRMRSLVYAGGRLIPSPCSRMTMPLRREATGGELRHFPVATDWLLRPHLALAVDTRLRPIT